MRPKDQGTRWERTILDHYTDKGWEIRRLAEHGQLDRGDLELVLGPRSVLVIEAKHRERLNVPDTVDKSAAKADPDPSIVLWKRSKRKDGNTRRSSQVTVSMTWDTFDHLLGYVAGYWQMWEWEDKA